MLYPRRESSGSPIQTICPTQVKLAPTTDVIGRDIWVVSSNCLPLLERKFTHVAAMITLELRRSLGDELAQAREPYLLALLIGLILFEKFSNAFATGYP